MNLNKYSKVLTQDDSLPASQAMIIGSGVPYEDLNKPFIGIGSTGFDGNPCNMHLTSLSSIQKKVFSIRKRWWVYSLTRLA